MRSSLIYLNVIFCSCLLSVLRISNGFSISTKSRNSVTSSTSSLLLMSSSPSLENTPSTNSSAKKSPYAVNLKCAVKPERREEFLSLIKSNQRKTLDTEPDALQYTVGEDIHTPNIFYIHEQFTDVNGFSYHKDTNHAAEWTKFKNSEAFDDYGPVEFFHIAEEVNQVPVQSGLYCVHVELCIKPAIREEFLEVIRNNAKGSNMEEELCLQYVYGEKEGEDNTFIFHEEYRGDEGGKEGFDAHTKSPHFADWEHFAATDPFTKEPVVSFFRTIE
mmetsp:Transcript_8234/g.11764  ORF Transcript_8234/g.11764 Transcript_8234/m.11764 type:complete len:274 (-) Transcript_8234:127-948(-)|eukprot:CAMPEP_0184867298 /NCGR_PEP_ID=MMETSP0580-20130426/25891_1 /TAXON_ID=1118495 /ORGANISM="Dactyliosolen fragilissimus" /LENGTH=273 /DNA_ID=CAMNT_0027367491 /DNA_START=173 /DNA_END=994 /DNA_ORIENTATION=-